jgi:hypothetical protein
MAPWCAFYDWTERFLSSGPEWRPSVRSCLIGGEARSE